MSKVDERLYINPGILDDGVNSQSIAIACVETDSGINGVSLIMSKYFDDNTQGFVRMLLSANDVKTIIFVLENAVCAIESN